MKLDIIFDEIRSIVSFFKSLGILSIFTLWLTISNREREKERERLNYLPMLEIKSLKGTEIINNIIPNYDFMITNSLNYIRPHIEENKNYIYRQKIRLSIKNISDNMVFNLKISELIIKSTCFKSIVEDNETSYNLLKFKTFLSTHKKNKRYFKKDEECNLAFSLNVEEFKKLDIEEKHSCMIEMELKLKYQDRYLNNYEQHFLLKEIELNTKGEYKKIDIINFNLPPTCCWSKLEKIWRFICGI